MAKAHAYHFNQFTNQTTLVFIEGPQLPEQPRINLNL